MNRSSVRLNAVVHCKLLRFIINSMRGTAAQATRTLQLAAMAGVVALPAHAGPWQHAHGDAANTGYADVATLPALRPDVLVPGIGSYAPGAGPVIGPDGTVYLGNQQGELRALRPDGSLAWMRTLNNGEAIPASPVVDADGSIFVVGTLTHRDHRVTPTVWRTDSRLYRFLPGGGLLWVHPFPEISFLGRPELANRGATSAPPNIWRHGTEAAVVIPAIYRAWGGVQLHLLAFSLDGALLADQKVTHHADTITGGADEFWCALLLCGLSSFSNTPAAPDPFETLPPGTTAPMAGVALFTFAGGGVPWVLVNDPWQATVGYTFNPRQGFAERFRKSDQGRRYATTPMALPDGHTVTGTGSADQAGGRLTFAGPNGVVWPDARLGSENVRATPARTSDQRIVAVGQNGTVSVVRNSSLLQSLKLNSGSVAPPAVSRTHVFVSTAGSFVTLNASTMAERGRVAWVGGGLSSPAIGADGRVYALASNTLFGWPGPAGSGPTAGGNIRDGLAGTRPDLLTPDMSRPPERGSHPFRPARPLPQSAQ
jgi:outer membrane protein assembly factor BamB